MLLLTAISALKSSPNASRLFVATDSAGVLDAFRCAERCSEDVRSSLLWRSNAEIGDKVLSYKTSMIHSARLDRKDVVQH